MVLFQVKFATQTHKDDWAFQTEKAMVSGEMTTVGNIGKAIIYNSESMSNLLGTLDKFNTEKKILLKKEENYIYFGPTSAHLPVELNVGLRLKFSSARSDQIGETAVKVVEQFSGLSPDQVKKSIVHFVVTDENNHVENQSIKEAFERELQKAFMAKFGVAPEIAGTLLPLDFGMISHDVNEKNWHAVQNNILNDGKNLEGNPLITTMSRDAIEQIRECTNAGELQAALSKAENTAIYFPNFMANGMEQISYSNKRIVTRSDVDVALEVIGGHINLKVVGGNEYDPKDVKSIRNRISQSNGPIIIATCNEIMTCNVSKEGEIIGPNGKPVVIEELATKYGQSVDVYISQEAGQAPFLALTVVNTKMPKVKKSKSNLNKYWFDPSLEIGSFGQAAQDMKKTGQISSKDFGGSLVQNEPYNNALFFSAVTKAIKNKIDGLAAVGEAESENPHAPNFKVNLTLKPKEKSVIGLVGDLGITDNVTDILGTFQQTRKLQRTIEQYREKYGSDSLKLSYTGIIPQTYSHYGFTIDAATRISELCEVLGADPKNQEQVRFIQNQDGKGGHYEIEGKWGNGYIEIASPREKNTPSDVQWDAAANARFAKGFDAFVAKNSSTGDVAESTP